MSARGATITMADMAAYYDNILKNGDGLPEKTRAYVTELRDQAVAGVFVVPDERLTMPPADRGSP